MSDKEHIAIKKTWSEFRNSGLLWFINTILHVFGWAIIVNIDNNGNVISVFPARINFRGYSDSINQENYKKLTDFLNNNIKDIKTDFE